jgi:hypothetical protein
MKRSPVDAIRGGRLLRSRRQCAPDCGQYRQAAGAGVEGLARQLGLSGRVNLLVFACSGLVQLVSRVAE